MTNVSRKGRSFGVARISKGLGVVVSFNRTSFNRTGTPAVRGLKAAWIALGEATLGGVTLVRATFAATVWLLAASATPAVASFFADCCAG